MGDELLHSDRAAVARYVLATRRAMKQAVAEDIVHNPAIEMLFTLTLAPKGDWMTADEVCAESTVTQDGCRRWGAVLAERDLIDVDGERYRLSDHGRAIMDDVGGAIRSLVNEHLRPPTE